MGRQSLNKSQFQTIVNNHMVDPGIILCFIDTLKREPHMETISTTTIRGHKLTLTARDQYNDYSVIFDYRIEVLYADGKGLRVDVGSNKQKAYEAFHAASHLLHTKG
jgi:hypothetical protein